MDGTGRVVFANAAWEAMVADARRRYPRECCGALLADPAKGDMIGVVAAIALPNHSLEPVKRFLIDPEELLEFTLEPRKAGLRLAGFYHSHPDKGAYFSKSDVAECWPGYVNVVLSVTDEGVKEARAYRLDPGRAHAASLGIQIEGAA